MVLKEQTMVRIQKIQRQPKYWTMRPPNRGPSVGPRRGPRRYQPKTPLRRISIERFCELVRKETYALWLGWNMSLMVPPPLAMPTPINCQYIRHIHLLFRIQYVVSRTSVVSHSTLRMILNGEGQNIARGYSRIKALTSKESTDRSHRYQSSHIWTQCSRYLQQSKNRKADQVQLSPPKCL